MKLRTTTRRLLIGLLMLAGAASAGLADTVYLVDGGSYQGKVRVDGERVIVEIPGGSMTLDRDRVARIEYGEDLYATLAQRRRQLNGHDSAGHYRLGLWAAQNNLPGPARELFAAAVKIQPDHLSANLALGRTYLDGAWLDGEAAGESLRQWLIGGMDAAALAVSRQSLAGLLTPAERRTMLDIAATAGRRLGYYSQAQADYRELAGLMQGGEPSYERAVATAELLKEYPAGLYLVQVDELALSVGRSDAEEPAHSGFYSLSDDAVLDYALRDRAKTIIGQGQGLMASGKTAEVTDSAKAASIYNQAEEQFVKAEALDAGIAHSYRVEIRRRLIQIHQSAAEALSLRFDALNRTLPAAMKVNQTYRNQLKLMLSLLEEIQKELDQILSLAAAFPQELNLVIAWTHEDLAVVKAMRKTLEGEQERVGVR